jgi:hypothetical protein
MNSIMSKSLPVERVTQADPYKNLLLNAFLDVSRIGFASLEDCHGYLYFTGDND